MSLTAEASLELRSRLKGVLIRQLSRSSTTTVNYLRKAFNARSRPSGEAVQEILRSLVSMSILRMEKRGTRYFIQRGPLFWKD